MRHPDLPGGLVLDSALFGPGSLADSLEVMARFRHGECGPLEVTADDIGTVSCPVLILGGEDDPASPESQTRHPDSGTGQLRWHIPA